MLALTALSLLLLSQNDQTEPLLDSDAMNINNINKEKFQVPQNNDNNKNNHVNNYTDVKEFLWNSNETWRISCPQLSFISLKKKFLQMIRYLIL